MKLWIAAALGILLWLLLHILSVAVRQAEATEMPRSVRLTWYVATGYPMYNGEYPHAGAAACSTHFPLGTQLVLPAGDIVVCKDRGYINSEPWVDVFVLRPAEGHLLIAFYSDRTTVRVLP